MMNPEDIFLWQDGFWCFREEFSPHFLRDEDYRVVSRQSDEWSGYANPA